MKEAGDWNNSLVRGTPDAHKPSDLTLVVSIGITSFISGETEICPSIAARNSRPNP